MRYFLFGQVYFLFVELVTDSMGGSITAEFTARQLLLNNTALNISFCDAQMLYIILKVYICGSGYPLNKNDQYAFCCNSAAILQ
jgi:hypothetical protein